MTKAFVLLSMVFMHILADFCLQGWLADAKQKSWWEKNAPEKMYKYDYICALLMHSCFWTFMMMLPAAVVMVTMVNDELLAIGVRLVLSEKFFVWFVCNTVWHALIDDFKANQKAINLIADQGLHILQILFTWDCLVL